MTLNRRLVRQTLATAVVASLLLVATASAAASGSLRHGFMMRGQVVEAKDTSLVICVGTADGASVGQQLDVVRHRRVGAGPKGLGRFERDVVGKVRIDAIVDEHYAQASVVSGSADENDSVELVASDG